MAQGPVLQISGKSRPQRLRYFSEIMKIRHEKRLRNFSEIMPCQRGKFSILQSIFFFFDILKISRGVVKYCIEHHGSKPGIVCSVLKLVCPFILLREDKNPPQVPFE